MLYVLDNAFYVNQYTLAIQETARRTKRSLSVIFTEVHTRINDRGAYGAYIRTLDVFGIEPLTDGSVCGPQDLFALCI